MREQFTSSPWRIGSLVAAMLTAVVLVIALGTSLSSASSDPVNLGPLVTPTEPAGEPRINPEGSETPSTPIPTTSKTPAPTSTGQSDPAGGSDTDAGDTVNRDPLQGGGTGVQVPAPAPAPGSGGSSYDDDDWDDDWDDDDDDDDWDDDDDDDDDD